MGGFMGGIFKGKNADGSPLSTGQDIVGGLMKGSALGTGSALDKPPGSNGGGASIPGAPPSTSVDAGYFAPTAMPPGSFAMRPGASPFYAQ